MVISIAPEKKGKDRLIASNMYPAIVGAMERRDIRAKLLMPMADAASEGLTILVAKDCLTGIVNIIIDLKIINSTIASRYQPVKVKATTTIEELSRDTMRVFISPSRLTTVGIDR